MTLTWVTIKAARGCTSKALSLCTITTRYWLIMLAFSGYYIRKAFHKWPTGPHSRIYPCRNHARICARVEGCGCVRDETGHYTWIYGRDHTRGEGGELEERTEGLPIEKGQQALGSNHYRKIRRDMEGTHKPPYPDFQGRKQLFVSFI